jgi:hypothetical protein
MLACRAAFAEIGSVASPLLLQQSRPLNAEYLVDAATTSFVASIGIAAAVVRRHWFLRFAAVGGVLALGLLVPAYEIVIEFAIQVAVISAGVALRRGASIRRPRISLETALLAMVVAAVMAAVVGAAPTFGWDTWARIVFLGLTLGVMSLLSLWIACGRASLKNRLSWGALGVMAFIAVFHFGIALRDAYYASQRGNDWWNYLVACYRPDFVSGWLKQVAPSIILGVVTFASLLMLARASGWFSEGEESCDSPPLGRVARTAARVCLSTGFGIIAAANLYLLYKLCTPPERLPENIPAANGYDDFIAAGKRTSIGLNTIRRREWSAWSDHDLEQLVVELRPLYDGVEAGLHKPCWVSCAYSDSDECADAQQAILNVAGAFALRNESLRRQDRWDEVADLALEGMWFAHESSRGHRYEFALDGHLENQGADWIQSALGAVSSAKCREVATRLMELDRFREPIATKLERQYIYRVRKSWQDHMTALMEEWNGSAAAASSEGVLRTGRFYTAATRLIIVQAALQAYWLDRRTLPERLGELVPMYLPSVPDDPMGDGPLKYARDRGVYRAYSVWHDGEDEGGVSWIKGSPADFVVMGPKLPPVPHRWKQVVADRAAEAFTWLKAMSVSAPTAPR